MGIRGNFSRNNIGVVRFVGGAQSLTPGNLYRPSNWVNFRTQSGATEFLKTAAYPTGYYPPATYNMPMVAGEMAAGLTGEGDVSANLYPSRNMEANLTGAGALSATGSLVVSMVAALTGSGSLAADIVGRLNMTADLTGSGAVTAAATGEAAMVAALTGSGTVTAVISAVGSMEADIVSTGSILTTANVADAVWDALTASHNVSGSFGEAMAAAGSAGDPWSTTLPGSYTGSQAGYLLYVMQQILRNKTKTDPATGIMTVYADNGTTVLFTANVFNDADGTEPYDGTTGVNLRDRLS